MYFSGKAKMHTVKARYTTSFDGLIVHKMLHFPGRDRDFKTYQVRHHTFPTGLPNRDGDARDKPGRDHIRHYLDTAYRGMNKVVEGMDARIPPSCACRARILSPTSGNTAGSYSRIRIRVENAIRRAKIFRIAKEK